MTAKLRDFLHSKLFIQIIKFGITGVIAAIVDVGTLVFFESVVHMDVILASAIAFCISVAVNYILSMAFVFEGSGKNKCAEFVVFVLLSCGGLALNQLIMWVGVKLLSVYYLIVKVIAMIFVPVYNFVTRKVFIEKKN